MLLINLPGCIIIENTEREAVPCIFFFARHIVYRVKKMNRRKFFGDMGSLRRPEMIGLAVCGLCFFTGCVIGVISAASVPDEAVDYLVEYVGGLSSGASVSGGYLKTLLRLLIYPLAAFLMGFSVLGAAAVPLLLLFRGYSLSFSLALFIGAFGHKGTLLAILLIGVRALISTPCLFVMAVQSFNASVKLHGLASRPDGGLRAGVYGRRYFLRLLLCVCFLMAAALAERAVLDILVPAAAGSI